MVKNRAPEPFVGSTISVSPRLGFLGVQRRRRAEQSLAYLSGQFERLARRLSGERFSQALQAARLSVVFG